MAVDRAAVVRRADEFVSQGKLDLAIAEYRALLDEQPSDLGAANTLGDLYARNGELAMAIDQFTRLAESERAQGFTSKAIALYKKALKVDPGCEQALSRLAEIAVGQDLLADATLYWNRLVQRRRERNDAAGVAEALMRLAALPVAKAETKLAAARAAEPHAPASETARLYAAAAAALTRDGRLPEALDAWLEAARRTDDVAVRHAAARACLDGGCLERALPFLNVDVAGDVPALLLAVGERAAEADDAEVAARALGRYRMLVPGDGDRVSALLARWELVEALAPAPGPLVGDVEADFGDAGHEVGGEVDLTALFADPPPDVPVPTADEAAGLPEDLVVEESVVDEPVVDEPVVEEAVVEKLVVEELVVEEPAVEEPPVMAAPALQPLQGTAVQEPGDDAGLEADEVATIAQLQAAADTPALQFQASAQLGRLFLQKGQVDRGIEWLERACAGTAPVREHGLAARYDLADALERAGQPDRALACWSDLEFDAGSYRDVPERLARLTRALGSA